MILFPTYRGRLACPAPALLLYTILIILSTTTTTLLPYTSAPPSTQITQTISSYYSIIFIFYANTNHKNPQQFSRPSLSSQKNIQTIIMATNTLDTISSNSNSLVDEDADLNSSSEHDNSDTELDNTSELDLATPLLLDSLQGCLGIARGESGASHTEAHTQLTPSKLTRLIAKKQFLQNKVNNGHFTDETKAILRQALHRMTMDIPPTRIIDAESDWAPNFGVPVETTQAMPYSAQLLLNEINQGYLLSYIETATVVIDRSERYAQQIQAQFQEANTKKAAVDAEIQESETSYTRAKKGNKKKNVSAANKKIIQTHDSLLALSQEETTRLEKLESDLNILTKASTGCRTVKQKTNNALTTLKVNHSAIAETQSNQEREQARAAAERTHQELANQRDGATWKLAPTDLHRQRARETRDPFVQMTILQRMLAPHVQGNHYLTTSFVTMQDAQHDEEICAPHDGESRPVDENPNTLDTPVRITLVGFLNQQGSITNYSENDRRKIIRSLGLPMTADSGSNPLKFTVTRADEVLMCRMDLYYMSKQTWRYLQMRVICKEGLYIGIRMGHNDPEDERPLKAWAKYSTYLGRQAIPSKGNFFPFAAEAYFAKHGIHVIINTSKLTANWYDSTVNTSQGMDMSFRTHEDFLLVNNTNRLDLPLDVNSVTGQLNRNTQASDYQNNMQYGAYQLEMTYVSASPMVVNLNPR